MDFRQATKHFADPNFDGPAISTKELEQDDEVNLDADEINGEQTPQRDPGNLIFDVEILIDRTSVESFFQNGQIVFLVFFVWSRQTNKKAVRL